MRNEESAAILCFASPHQAPLTIGSKLVGTEALVIALAMKDPSATVLLAVCESLCSVWLQQIRSSGFDAIVFDSTAAPPVISPYMYKSTIGPYHRRIMSLLESSGQRDRPLIIGGNSSPIAADIADTGASTLICDYAADAAEFRSELGSERLEALSIRRNIDPSIFLPTQVSFESAAFRYADELLDIPNPIAGTGILPYDADPARYLEFKSGVLKRLLL